MFNFIEFFVLIFLSVTIIICCFKIIENSKEISNLRKFLKERFAKEAEYLKWRDIKKYKLKKNVPYKEYFKLVQYLTIFNVGEKDLISRDMKKFMEKYMVLKEDE